MTQKKSTDAQQNALIREVWDGMREQKLLEFVKKHQKLIIFGISVFFISLAGIEAYKSFKRASVLEEARIFEQAINQEPVVRQNMLTSLSETGSHGYVGISVLMRADQAVRSGDISSALDILSKGYKQTSDTEIKSLILLKEATLRADSLSFESLRDLLDPLLSAQDPFYASATLLLASKALDENNTETAQELLDSILADSSISFTIRSSAQELKNAL